MDKLADSDCRNSARTAQPFPADTQTENSQLQLLLVYLKLLLFFSAVVVLVNDYRGTWCNEFKNRSYGALADHKITEVHAVAN